MVLITNTVEVFLFLSIKVVYQGSCFIHLNIKTNHFFSFYWELWFQWRPQALVFEFVTDKKFDMIIMIFIGLNMLTMTMDHYQQTQFFTSVLDILNGIFIVIFSSECILKIFALRYYYFKEPWNLFDFVVVILSILGEFCYEICHENKFLIIIKSFC